MWGVSAQLLRKMEEARTPQAKQHCLGAAIEAINYSYSLSFPGRENEKKATTEFLIPALLLVLFQAKLRHPLATIKYMKEYNQWISEYNQDEFNRVTFHSCITYLLEFDIKSVSQNGNTIKESGNK